jgi:hypothetical protein
MKRFITLLGAGAASLALVAGLALGQEPPKGKKKVPTLTTEDVVRSRGSSEASRPPAEAAEEAKPVADAAPPVKPVSGAEQAAWRARVKRSREVFEALDRQAEETEIKVTELRNRLGYSGQTPQERDQTSNEMEATGKQVLELRARARQARDEYEAILEAGHAKGFTEEEGPAAVGKDGKPNAGYYKTRFLELQRKVEDSQRGMRLYENRVRDYNQRMMVNAKSGDNYYLLQVQQERDQAQSKLDQARADAEKAELDLENLLEEARRAGLPPGIFR